MPPPPKLPPMHIFSAIYITDLRHDSVTPSSRVLYTGGGGIDIISLTLFSFLKYEEKIILKKIFIYFFVDRLCRQHVALCSKITYIYLYSLPHTHVAGTW